MEKIKIGKITSPVGLKGEVKIASYSDDPERFEMLGSVFADRQKYLRAAGIDGTADKNKAAGITDNKRRKADICSDDSSGKYVELLIENIRYKGQSIILKLKGIDDRNVSERARGMELFMDAADLPELEEGQFYVRDILGFKVVTRGGELLGTLKDVLTNTAQDIYIVSRTGEQGDTGSQKQKGAKARELMIPGVPEFILGIDTEKRKITVELPEGLMEL